MSRIIRIFTVCLVSLYFIQIIKTLNTQDRCPNLAGRPNRSDFTIIVLTLGMLGNFDKEQSDQG